MAMKKIIFRDVRNMKIAGRWIKELDKKGFKNTIIVDRKVIGTGKRMKGIGIRVMAFKGRKNTPKNFKTKKELF